GAGAYFFLVYRPVDSTPFKTFVNQKPPKIGTVRVRCSLSDDYPPGADRKTMLAIRLAEGDTSRTYTCIRNDGMGKRFTELLKDGPRELNLHLALNPGTHPGETFLQVLEIVEKSP